MGLLGTLVSKYVRTVPIGWDYAGMHGLLVWNLA